MVRAGVLTDALLRSARWLVVLAAVGAVAAPTAEAQKDPPDPGKSEDFTYSEGTLSGTYRTYTPASYARASGPVPLLVVIHGCATTAEQQERANQQNRIAEREGLIILYPNNGELKNAQCWDWYSAGRDSTDAALIVGMVKEVQERARIDAERVYVIGMSSGGMLTSVLMASYPEVFAAGGLMAGIAYKDLGCPFTGVTIPPDTLAQQAFEAMGPRARVTPMIVLGGTEDTAVLPACQENGMQQWIKTNELVLGGPLSPGPSRQVPKPGGWPSTVTTYQDVQGCLVVERWVIEGMGHYWSGGTSDPEYATWTDPKGPSAGEASWDFFKRFRLSDTGAPCAETKPAAPVQTTAEPTSSPAGTPACSPRRATLRLPRNARRVRITIDGKRIKARVRTVRGRRSVRIALPAAERVVVRISARVMGKRYTRKRTLRGCA